MSNVGLEFATAVNWYEIGKALDYGKSNLDSETYKKVVDNFKKMIKHTLLWVLIAMAVGGSIAAISKYISDTKLDALLEAHNATQWVTGVRADATTVQYTRGESYRYDVSALGINLDSDFPEQRSLILLLDDSNQLQAVISQKEYEKISNIFPIGLILEDGSYRLDIPVDIYMLIDTRCVYKVGEGRLIHTTDGFELTGCDGKLQYRQLPQASYSLYSDFYWYEIGDMISIGDAQVQYYCFPKHGENVVAKTRLATEELYKMKKAKQKVRESLWEN